MSFKRFYVWVMRTKQWVALYFMGLVFYVGLCSWVGAKTPFTLVSLLQIFCLCWAVALLQVVLVGHSTDYSHGLFSARSVIWLLVSVAAVVLVGLFFNWLADGPRWAAAGLGVFSALMFLLVLLGQCWKQQVGTHMLNHELRNRRSYGA